MRRPYLPPDVWRAKPGDKTAIAKPLASIASRHAGPIGASADLVDGARLVLGVADYALTNTDAEDQADAELAAAMAQLPTAPAPAGPAGDEIPLDGAAEPAVPASEVARRFLT